MQVESTESVLSQHKYEYDDRNYFTTPDENIIKMMMIQYDKTTSRL